MTIGGCVLSAMMAGGVRPSVKMAKAGLDDEVGRESSTMTSGAGGTATTIGDDDGGEESAGAAIILVKLRY